MRIQRKPVLLSARDRRAIRIGALTLLPALVYVGAVKPYVRTIGAMRDELRAQQTLLEREEEIARSSLRIATDLGAARRTASRFGIRAYDASDTVVAMTLVSRDINRALEDAELVERRIEVRDSIERGGGLTTVTADVRAEGDFQGILNALAAVEASSRLLRVSRLAIERSTTAAAPNRPALSLIAVVRGYAR